MIPISNGSVLQCAAVCCGVVQSTYEYNLYIRTHIYIREYNICISIHLVVVCCSLLQCVAVC